MKCTKSQTRNIDRDVGLVHNEVEATIHSPLNCSVKHFINNLENNHYLPCLHACIYYSVGSNFAVLVCISCVMFVNCKRIRLENISVSES